MKTEWDYTNLATAYLKRPEYAPLAISRMFETAGVKSGNSACDIGAGAAHLTIELAKFGLKVCAVEPNDAMRANGIKRTAQYSDVKWFEGVGEDTKMEANNFEIVTFGSSFNVCDRIKALEESNRILKPNGWFACMWNHRDLDDPIQQKIENVIKSHIDNYSYGSRREDQTEIINKSGLFKDVVFISGNIVHSINAEDFIEGWKSHGTVYRQSPEIFEKIISDIRRIVESLNKETIEVPYTTRIWMAQTKK